jgi:hypothetical protein
MTATTVYTFRTHTPTLAEYRRMLDRKRRQHGRFLARAERAWQAYNMAIDNLAPRETIVKLAEYADAMEELRMSVWRKIDGIKAEVLHLVRVA